MDFFAASQSATNDQFYLVRKAIGVNGAKLHNGALPVATGLIFAGALTVWGMRRRRARREDGGLIK